LGEKRVEKKQKKDKGEFKNRGQRGNLRGQRRKKRAPRMKDVLRLEFGRFFNRLHASTAPSGAVGREEKIVKVFGRRQVENLKHTGSPVTRGTNWREK